MGLEEGRIGECPRVQEIGQMKELTQERKETDRKFRTRGAEPPAEGGRQEDGWQAGSERGAVELLPTL